MAGKDGYDAVVVGGGPAGLSAATWLSRYRRRVLLLDEGQGRNRWTEKTHGYLGSDPIDPRELERRALADLASYPESEVREGRATGARRDEGQFVITTDDATLSARRLVLATGVVDEFPDVGGFFDHYGVNVFHCPTCDGYEAKDAAVVVFGWTEEVASFALEIDHWASRVTVVTDGHHFEGDEEHEKKLESRGVRLMQDVAVELKGPRGSLQGVQLGAGDYLDCNFAFFSIEHHPGSDLAEQLGCEITGEDCVAVAPTGETSVTGVYAAGDMTPGIQLVQMAAAKGATAGIECALSLQGR
jgi:thioredoxin reductase